MSDTVLEALRKAQARLRHIPDPKLDAEYLLSHVLGLPRMNMLLDKRRTLTNEETAAFEALVRRREGREPLQYILGSQSFMGFPFKTDSRALIPRGDTEILCEEALRRIRPGDAVLDLCTGSGCLAVAIKKLCPKAQVTATDISGDALSLARENARALDAPVQFLQGDLFAPLAGRRFHVIVSNPPYIPDRLTGSVQEELKKEPPQALFAPGEDGMQFLSRIIAQAPDHLLPGGWLLLEFGDGQAEKVAKAMERDFAHVRILTDWQALPRAACGQWKEGCDRTDGSSV